MFLFSFGIQFQISSFKTLYYSFPMPSHSYICSPCLNFPPFPMPNPPAYSYFSSSSLLGTPPPQSAISSCPPKAQPAPLACRRNLAGTPQSAPEELRPRRPRQASPPSLPAQAPPQPEVSQPRPLPCPQPRPAAASRLQRTQVWEVAL